MQNLTTLPQRIEHVGKTVFRGHGWTRRLANAMGISRSQLYEFRNGRGNRDRDIDAELIAMIERERGAAAKRRVELTQLRNRLLSLCKRGA